MWTFFEWQLHSELTAAQFYVIMLVRATSLGGVTHVIYGMLIVF